MSNAQCGQVATAPHVSIVKAVVDQYFPNYWPMVDAALATYATLLLQDTKNPVAVIFVGGPSSGKTTVVDMFKTHAETYPSDQFTPKSFVSHSANVSRDRLASIDLLPRIRHKLLATPELAPIFRGKDDELRDDSP